MKHLISTIKKNRFTVAALAIFVGVVIVWLLANNPDQKPGDRMLPVTINAITTKNGWGYEIFVDGKIFIKQERVPAVQGFRYFSSKEQALAVGNLAVKKIVKGQIPSITLSELKSLGVLE